MMLRVGGEVSYEVHVFGCAECPRVSTASARGWKAYLIDDPDEEDSPKVEFLCPCCAGQLAA